MAYRQKYIISDLACEKMNHVLVASVSYYKGNKGKSGLKNAYKPMLEDNFL